MSDPSPVGFPLALKCLGDPSEAKSHAVAYFYYSPYAALIIAIIYYSARVLPFAILYFVVRLFGDWRSGLVSVRWGVALLIAAAIPCLLVLFGGMPSNDYGGMRDVVGFRGVDWFTILKR